jgi:Fe-S-cluster formation regulator IscX/YfhJ
VGEEPSNTAKKNNWSWEDGRLAAKQLFDALIAHGIDPKSQLFTNLFEEDYLNESLERIESAILEGFIIVAMGRKTDLELSKRKIKHLRIVHPAARGKIRNKSCYQKHISESLGF